MAFFRHFGVKNGLFWGVKLRVGGNTPKGVYYHHWGDFIERFGRKMREKIAKNGNVHFLHTSFWAYLGLSGCQIAPP